MNSRQTVPEIPSIVDRLDDAVVVTNGFSLVGLGMIGVGYISENMHIAEIGTVLGAGALVLNGVARAARAVTSFRR